MLLKFLKNTIAILLIQFSLSNIALAGESNIWSFVGRASPDHWSKLDKAFEACNEGESNNPTIITNNNLIHNASTIVFDYNTYPYSSSENSPSKHVLIGETNYKLIEFHIHTPSEHSINGDISKAAIHFIHQDSQNNIAVIAVMLRIGKSNEVIKRLIETYNKSDQEKFSIEDGNLMALVPTNTEYYYHKGNITTPPCTENVSWYVMQNPVEISKEELTLLNSIIK